MGRVHIGTEVNSIASGGMLLNSGHDDSFDSGLKSTYLVLRTNLFGIILKATTRKAFFTIPKDSV